MNRLSQQAALGILLAALALPSWATLGEPVSSTSAGSGIRAAVSVRQEQGYSVEESSDAAGRQIREFVNGAGVVFAVSWQGKSLPNLQQLLGNYFPTYIDAAKQNKHGLNTLQGNSDELVIVSRGHMGAFSGYAYVPALVPAGVDIQKLQ